MKMLKIEVQEELYDSSTEWQTVMTGRALFQETLVPDEKDKPVLIHQDAFSSKHLHDLLGFF
jgi:hypothetical protein